MEKKRLFYFLFYFYKNDYEWLSSFPSVPIFKFVSYAIIYIFIAYSMFLAFLYIFFENILYRNVCIFDYLLQFTFRCFKHSLKTLLFFQNSLHTTLLIVTANSISHTCEKSLQPRVLGERLVTNVLRLEVTSPLILEHSDTRAGLWGEGARTWLLRAGSGSQGDGIVWPLDSVQHIVSKRSISGRKPCSGLKSLPVPGLLYNSTHNSTSQLYYGHRILI